LEFSPCIFFCKCASLEIEVSSITQFLEFTNKKVLFFFGIYLDYFFLFFGVCFWTISNRLVFFFWCRTKNIVAQNFHIKNILPFTSIIL
jgi:hypothetical protein